MATQEQTTALRNAREALATAKAATPNDAAAVAAAQADVDAAEEAAR